MRRGAWFLGHIWVIQRLALVDAFQIELRPGFRMIYRIRYFRDDVKMGDIATNKRLPDTREAAVKYMALFNADYALIVDEGSQLIDPLKRSA
jgi:hypothetical protein